MDLDLAAVVLAAVTNSLLGLIVFFRNVRSLVNQTFLLVTVSVVVWSITNYFADHSTGDFATDLFTRFAFAGAIWIGFALVAFSYRFPRTVKRSKHFDKLFWAGFFLSSLYAVSPLVTINSTHGSQGAVIEPGVLYYGYIVLFGGLAAWAVLRFAHSFKVATVTERNQLRVIAFGVGVSTLLGIFTNLIFPLFNGDWATSKVGPFVTVFFVGSLSYAIIRQRFLDIKLFVARSLAYFLLLLSLSAIYVALAFGIGSYFFENESITTSQQVFNASLALLLAFAFQPLRRFFEKVTDRIFYKYRFDANELQSNLTRTLAANVRLDPLLQETVALLGREMKLSAIKIIILQGKRVYRDADISNGGHIIASTSEIAQLNKHILVTDDIPFGRKRSSLEAMGIRVSAPLHTRNELVGFLLLGDKLSGDLYSKRDIDLIRIMGREIAIAVTNARSFEEIARFNETLKQKISEATTRLRVANKNLKALDKAKDDFISVASHQLRTPLTAVKGYLSMLREGDAGPVTEEQKDFIDTAFSSSERMVRLIADLLNVSRLAAGRFTIEPKPTDLVATIKDEIRQLASHAAAKGLYLNFEMPKKPLAKIVIDEDKTRQVMMNFMDNAIYYTEQGGVTVRLTAEKGSIRFTVTDTGIGVPPDAQKKLFTKFFRADNAQTLRPDGTGLGLYLAKQVIEDEGGELIFSSVQGHGSTFGFKIPIKLEDRLKASAATVPDVAPPAMTS